jgi:hypothetical protein
MNHFPSIKFSVKSSGYSGGASINVKLRKRPNSCNKLKLWSIWFEGAYFDGMTDYKGYNYYHDGWLLKFPFGANFIFVNRKMTKGFLEGAVTGRLQILRLCSSRNC